MSVAPDYAAPLIGWRCWAAVETKGGLTLRSVHFKSRWPPGERLEAVCAHRLPSALLARLLGMEPHEAPDESCQCGIYAARAPDLTIPYLERLRITWGDRSALIGRVALWGRVIECERGWRGTFAYPTHLYLLRAYRSERQRPDAGDLAAGLAGYGVPVEELEASALAALLAQPAPTEAAVPGAA